MISRSSGTVLLPAGGVRFCRKGRPAASMSIAMATGSALRTCSSLAKTVSRSHGFTVGTPMPPAAEIAASAPSITAAFVPSPVKARTPDFAQDETSRSL